jgi:outer membrane protein TolC
MQNLLHPPAAGRRKSVFAIRLVPAQLLMAGAFLAAASVSARAQLSLGTQQSAPAAVPSSSYQGSVSAEKPSADTLALTLDEAVQRGLRTNLGLLLTTTQVANARGQRLQDLQTLLPTIDLNVKQAYLQSDLAAEGLKIPGFPTIIGPFGYQDARANLTWKALDLRSLKTYMASRHYFQAAQLSADDAKQMVILTVGNAYLKVLADQAQINATQAQVETSKVSLDQATSNHTAGTAPRLDELRAQVDYQSQQQQLISAKNAFEKDKLALARTIGLPLAQKFDLADAIPYAAFDQPDVQTAIKQALDNRKDRKASEEETKATKDERKAATDDRLPTVEADADYGAIGTNLRHSHGTVDATGTITIPIFKEAQFRGEAQVAQAALDQQKDQQSDLDAQIEADVREAQQRYKAGVSDNLAVSDAQQSVAQANSQYVNSLYQHNVAKLNLARAMGVAQNYKEYLGGK